MRPDSTLTLRIVLAHDGMAEVHQLILQQGIAEARRQAMTKHERIVVEAAYQVLSEDAEKMGFSYSGFALTSLPHKPQREGIWRREGHSITLIMQSGADRVGKLLGLPYGSYARTERFSNSKPCFTTELKGKWFVIAELSPTPFRCLVVRSNKGVACPVSRGTRKQLPVAPVWQRLRLRTR
jgi:hypothetical protein